MEKKIFNTHAYYKNEIPESAPELFHYTDAGGFIGMAKHKTMWMSNINYQNDSEEYYYIFERTADIMKEKYPGLLPSIEYLKRPNIVSTIFTFSLSQREDMLSQWRGYCPNGGFCVSFNKDHLNAAIKREKMFVAECIYKLDEQEEFIINNIIGFTPQDYKASKSPTSEGLHGDVQARIHYVFKNISVRLNEAAPLLKHPSFSEEKEWRIFTEIDHSTDDQSLARAIRHYPPHEESKVKFRSRNNLLIPYLELKIEEAGSHIENHISRVTVSPTPHKNLAVESCNALLKVSECAMNAKNSNIPYINW